MRHAMHVSFPLTPAALSGHNLGKEDPMRSDPYEQRARALAVEAGLDPNVKIDRPGLRPMPVWCTFRDAARQEHMMQQAGAVAAGVAAGRSQGLRTRTAH
jgi:hypothetical protein